ncbi:hypothetical protein SAURM35S_09005 [Streptomyces aurantiogriseus]
MLMWTGRPTRTGSAAQDAVALSRQTTSRIGGSWYLAYRCAK